ncbi:uncharacterized protein F5147DRAFT_651404 [Suillus discolor]|uniref:Uncharacterized protein n=1 Tax=Suillus discolor TaxID=1912936 RepID=A0A9P7FB32_9AGAM|nr:uncharacterized protein F5147DRAFT_651404 [Suillus discolor]KAG2111196.1 hypothetical protein F5147DRAFT_651404 [Suillus discolor]
MIHFEDIRLVLVTRQTSLSVEDYRHYHKGISPSLCLAPYRVSPRLIAVVSAWGSIVIMRMQLVCDKRRFQQHSEVSPHPSIRKSLECLRLGYVDVPPNFKQRFEINLSTKLESRQGMAGTLKRIGQGVHGLCGQLVLLVLVSAGLFMSMVKAGKGVAHCTGSKDLSDSEERTQLQRRLQNLTPEVLSDAVIAVHANVEWRRVGAIAAALRVDAVQKHFMFLDLLAKSEADTHVNAVMEPLETAIGALSSDTTDELNDCRNSSIAAFNLDVTPFVAADTELDHVEDLSSAHFHLPQNNTTAE